MSRRDYPVRPRPRDETRYVSQGWAVLATARDEAVAGGEAHGLDADKRQIRYHQLRTRAAASRPPSRTSLWSGARPNA